MLRDAHGRIQGSYQNGKLDRKPVAGKDLTLGLDVKLQALGERLLQGKSAVSLPSILERAMCWLWFLLLLTIQDVWWVETAVRCTSGSRIILGNRS